MKEYIEKDAAIGIIANMSVKRIYGDDISRMKVLSAIAAVPAADVKPVVYCRECKYATSLVTGECVYCAFWGDMFQTHNKLYLRADFFCAAGEKRKSADMRKEE